MKKQRTIDKLINLLSLGGYKAVEEELEYISQEEIDKCPATLTGRHAWYQTTLAKVFSENDKHNSEDQVDGVRYSHACKCGQWRTGVYDK